jgi:hypothetical protein
MKTYFTLLVIFMVAATGYSTRIHVPLDYPTIQQAINAAQDGDTILVSPGTYTENINFLGKGIVLTSNFIFSHNLDDINNTIIDGSSPSDPDTASCVLMYKPNNSFSDDSSATLIGFTITGGKGTAWNDEHNLGSYYREGGGILIQYWAPRIRFNIIRDNEAYDKTGLVSAGGGAIRCGDGNPLIENNIILHNRGRYGGGIVFNYSGGVIRNNILDGNSGGEDYAGGGLWILGNRFDNRIKVIENNAIIHNTSVLPGGGVFLWGSTGNYIRNNIIWGNLAPSNSQLRVQSSQAQIVYNDIDGGYAGEGNINLDPDFILPGFYLNDTSPCIDAGKDSLAFNDIEDPLNPGFALWPSKGTTRNDMGVYGGPNCSDLPEITTSVDDDITSEPDGFMLFQNYPNPFNPSTSLQYAIGSRQFVTLKVYDLLGREVATLVNEEKEPGVYEVEFGIVGTSRDLSLTSGVYFYHLNAGSFIETKKMILLR